MSLRRICFICLGAGTLAARSHSQDTLAYDDSSCSGVLFFSAVGSVNKELVARNVQHLHSTGEVDIFLAHYDLTDWPEEAWYQDTVKYKVSYSAQKVDFVFQELVMQRTFALQSYCYYWVSDDNVDFTQMDVSLFFALARESGANIFQPAIDFDGKGIPSHEAMNVFRDSVALPNGKVDRSLYRYSDFVEIMSPVFHGLAVLQAAYEIYARNWLHSDWGMDEVWCRYVAARLGRPQNTSCAIIDATTMVKMPHRRSYDKESSFATAALVIKQYMPFRQQSMSDAMLWVPGVTQKCKVGSSDDLITVHMTPHLHTSLLALKALVRCRVFYGSGAECYHTFSGFMNAYANLDCIPSAAHIIAGVILILFIVAISVAARPYEYTLGEEPGKSSRP
eukprot:TRINITY_DN82250_c0_g1_i1.p1 TRINITY_DN82250_c0_g1~~TRINITY_DN82250_c0_g1_i1.p1  ORF type:complete len:392 (+),score=48.99 TRINITY_DN82250_c0_g1_i1:64-1239(+)